MTLFGIHLVSLGAGVVLAQFLPGTVGAWIVSKVKGVQAVAAPLVAKAEAEVKKAV